MLMQWDSPRTTCAVIGGFSFLVVQICPLGGHQERACGRDLDGHTQLGQFGLHCVLSNRCNAHPSMHNREPHKIHFKCAVQQQHRHSELVALPSFIRMCSYLSEIVVKTVLIGASALGAWDQICAALFCKPAQCERLRRHRTA